jgi:asparagine synthase (glutamine-hydrolysing)
LKTGHPDDYVGNINEHYLDCQGQNSFTEIDEWLDIMEMPYKFFENSFWLKAAYEKARQEKVGVLLSGARGNFTVSWGITFDYYAQLLKKMKWVQLYKELFQYSRNMAVPRSRVMKVVGKKAFPLIQKLFEKEQEESIFPLINPDFAEKTDVFNKLQAYGIDVDGKGVTGRDSIRIQHFQQLFSWSTTGTADTKLSLNYGLQGRDPTNDLRVIQYCLSVPSEQYAQNGLDRALIRNAMENYLPDTVRLNQRVRGIQAADSIHRMLPDWKQFISQVEEVRKDQDIFYFINKKTFENAMATLSHKPSVTYAFSEEFKLLMRSLILYRFIKRFL